MVVGGQKWSGASSERRRWKKVEVDARADRMRLPIQRETGVACRVWSVH